MDYNEIIQQAAESNNPEIARAALEAAAQVEAAQVAARGMAQAAAVISMMGSAIGEGLLVSAAFNAIGRNPKLESSLFGKILVAAAVVETTAIYAFLAFLIVTFV